MMHVGDGRYLGTNDVDGNDDDDAIVNFSELQTTGNQDRSKDEELKRAPALENSRTPLHTFVSDGCHYA